MPKVANLYCKENSYIILKGILFIFQGEDETVRIVSMNKDFHVKCYVCEVSLSGNQCCWLTSESVKSFD